MNKYVKIILWVFVVLLIIFSLLCGYLYNEFDVDMDPRISNNTIEFKQLNEIIYIRTKLWGISGNHSEILLSNALIKNVHNEYMVDKQYTYKDCSEIYYQKKGLDSLIIYVDHISNIPKNMETQIIISQIKLENAKEIQDYSKNYGSYGLTKISVYSSN